MRKYLFMLIFLVCFNYASKSYAITFKDVETKHWFYNDVILLTNKGIIKGYEDGTFRPNVGLKRNEFIALLVRALTSEDYPGVSGDWSKGVIDKAREMQIIEVDSKNKTKTYYNSNINKGEVAELVVNALYYLDEKYPIDYEKHGMLLRDNMLIDDNQKDNIYKAYYKGILVGYPDDTFKQRNILTRAEAATVINRIINKDVRKSIGVLNPTDTNNLLNNYAKGYYSNYKVVKEVKQQTCINVVKNTSEIVKKAVAYVEDIEYGPYKREYRESEENYLNRYVEICGTEDVYYNDILYSYSNYARIKRFDRQLNPSNCKVTFVTNENLIYTTNLNTIKIRGILKIAYDMTNDKNIDINKIYEKIIDVELVPDEAGNVWAKQMIEIN